MKRIVLAVCLLAFCRDANADVIIGNSVAGPYQGGTNIGTKSLEFHTGSSILLLDDIQVALGGMTGGGAGGSVRFTLNADANGLPGAVIALIGTGTVTAFFAPPAPFRIAPAVPLLLNPNTSYWIQAVFIVDPVTNGSADWVRTDPASAPSSPLGLATFVKYVFDGGSGPVDSTTFNAIVVNGRTVARSSGTAARAILTGSRCGQAIPSLDEIHGDYGVDAFSRLDYDHVGWSGAAGILPATGPRVGAYVTTNNLIAAAIGTPLGVGVAGARAIAFSQYRNNTTGSLAVSATANLDGEFFSAPNLSFRSGLCGEIDANASGGQGHSTAAVYVFDADKFLNAIDSSHQSVPEYLLGSDTLADYQSGTASTLALTRFTSLSAAVIAQHFLQVDPLTFTPGMNVGPGVVVVAPGQSVIVVFDISAYSPPGASVRFIDTLKPAPGFMTGMTPVGTSTPEPPAAAHLTLTPSSITSPITTPVTVTATATTASGSPIPNTIVLLEMTAGPNAHPLGPAVTDANGQVSFTYAGGAIAGIDVIYARVGAVQSNAAAITWTTPGPLDHIAVDPASATITAGSSRTYATQALDVFAHGIGDVTAGTTFTISPDGSCTGASCTASIAGPHTVTATYNGKIATATLNVTPSTYVFEGFSRPIDMSTPALIVWNTVNAGQAVPVKWLLTRNGSAVFDSTSFVGLSSYPVLCSSGSGSIDDAIDQTATGGSGLQYSGGGNWQFNWQTSPSDKGACRAIAVTFNDGTTSPVAYFKFK